MTKIEAIVQPGKFESVKTALIDSGIDGMTVSEVRGHGRQKGHTEVFRGREYSVDFLPKIKVELIVDDDLLDKAIDVVMKSAYTGRLATARSSSTRWKMRFVSAVGRGEWPQFNGGLVPRRLEN